MKMHFLRDMKHHASGFRHISKLLMIRKDLGGGQITPDLPTASFLRFCVKQQVQITVRGDTGPVSSGPVQHSNSTSELHARHSSSTWNTYMYLFF